MTVYDPRTSRELAERSSRQSGSDTERAAAHAEFERYHSADRMLRLASEVECLRELIAQARRIRYSSDVGYVEVRHLFAAVRAMDSERTADASLPGRNARCAAPAPVA
jgi:hypothetical protein